MIYFKNESGEVFAYETEAERERFGAAGLVEMTETEVVAHLNPAAAPLTREQVEGLRLQAYADPITGSDRHFAEATRLQVMSAPRSEIDAAKAAGVARYAEIQEQYPWP